MASFCRPYGVAHHFVGLVELSNDGIVGLEEVGAKAEGGEGADGTEHGRWYLKHNLHTADRLIEASGGQEGCTEMQVLKVKTARCSDFSGTLAPAGTGRKYLLL